MDGRLDSDEPSDSPTTSMETSSDSSMPLAPSSGSMQSVDLDEACSSVMNGSQLKRKPDERKHLSRDQSRTWRQRQKLDPPFQKKERKRSKDRHQKSQKSKPKRKPDERKIPSCERSRTWRQRQNLDPPFQEKERKRSRERRQNCRQFGINYACFVQ